MSNLAEVAPKQRVKMRERLYDRRFLVPNAVTLGNMFCGFLTIIYASSGRFEKGAIAIAIALLLDGLDGRVARRLNATSKFGVEFDSFADLISFGVAPAMLMYHWCFRQNADEFGVLICFIYALCAASRLARFNIAEPSLVSFVGLPTPGSAALVVALVNFWPAGSSEIWVVALVTALLLSLSYLMVSRIPFFSMKQANKRSLRLFGPIVVGGIIALIWYDSGISFLVLATVYCLSGPLGLLRRRKAMAAGASLAVVGDKH